MSRKYNVEELLKKPSFIRWAKGEATDKERRFWDEWVTESPVNRSVAKEAMQKIAGFFIDPAELNISTDQSWNALRHRAEHGYSPHTLRMARKKKVRKNRGQWILRIAAVLLLGFVSVYIATQYDPFTADSADASGIAETEVATEYGVQKTVRFSDGSEIILNGNSRLVTTKDRSNSSAIELFLEGEAYFSITPRENPEDHPFRIQTPNGLVNVLGTQLVVSTRQDQTRVFLESGRVAVNPCHLDDETILVPGQLVGFDSSSRQLEVQFVNPEIYTSWINGRLYFEQADVEEVLHRIEDTFGVRAVVRDSVVLEHKVSGSIESSELDIITSALSVVLNTTIEKSESDNVIYLGSNPD